MILYSVDVRPSSMVCWVYPSDDVDKWARKNRQNAAREKRKKGKKVVDARKMPKESVLYIDTV